MSSAIAEVVILCWNAPTVADRNAHKIAAFLGVQVTFAHLTGAALSDGASLRTLVPRCTCLIVNTETLAQAADAMPTGVSGLSSLKDSAENVFIYGAQPIERHGAVLCASSSGSLLGVQRLGGSGGKFQVAEGHRERCGPFSGLTLGTVDPGREYCFREGTENRRPEVMIRAAGKPFFVRTNDASSSVFYLACSELADLDENVPREVRLLSWFSRLAPLVMFLRGALRDRVWHNDKPQACFIIDDPLLQNHYGFLDYRGLLKSMRQQKFSTCIAFIPWNYRRSSAEVAGLISSNLAGPHLCIHGCDHTRGEFATTDLESLCGKAQLALERMRAHHRLSGIPFDDIMVFPQGLFSSEAMAALKASGYLAAVNSDAYPSATAETLALRDLLDVAVTKFAGFPLFGRRYPHALEELAFDLFMGKPALAVEHHGYFRDGHKALETFAERLNSLEERLEWSNLGTICSRASLTRTAENGEVHVRFYTNRFSLTNTGTRTQRYLLLTRQAPSGPLPSVTVNGRHWDCGLEGGQLKIRLSLDAGETAEIRILSRDLEPAASSWRATEIHNLRVRIRRLLCEIRDNHVDTNRVLHAIASTFRNFGRHAKLQTAK